jgi:hypothetical protein
MSDPNSHCNQETNAKNMFAAKIEKDGQRYYIQ